MGLSLPLVEKAQEGSLTLLEMPLQQILAVVVVVQEDLLQLEVVVEAEVADTVKD